MPVVNGKRVNIKTREENTKGFLSWFSQFDDVNATDVKFIPLFVVLGTRNNKILLSSLAYYIKQEFCYYINRNGTSQGGRT